MNCLIIIMISFMSSVNLIIIRDESPKSLDNEQVIYYKDHEVNYDEAKENIKSFRENTFQHCSPCTLEHKKYCESEDLLNDHCCCNQGYSKDQLYFMPHTCYMSDKPCTPSWGSCLTTMEIRSCCCDPYLLRKWKSVLSNASWSSSRLIYVLFPLIFTFIMNFL